MKRNIAEETKVVAFGKGEPTRRTLRELGMPGELATRLEVAFDLLGATEGDRIVGFTFVDVKGNRHSLRTEVAMSPAIGRAA